MSTPSVRYVGDSVVIAGGSGGDNNAYNGFVDAYAPVPAKSEWGMDTLTRHMRGTQPNIVAFVAGLAQSLAYVFNGGTYYLQSFEPDNNPVFPGVTMQYKGLHGGIPNPKSSGGTAELSVQIAVQSVGMYTNVTRDIRYITRQSETLYITNARPTAPTYGLDVDQDIYILSSVIRAEDSSGNQYVWGGADAPADVVTATTPATTVQAFTKCTPVVGSVYFECADTATKIYEGS